jgi:signal transduction histidine kinase
MLLEDVSEAKALGEQLRQAQKMEAIGQLTGGIAHDFNNLLTVILGNLELLDSQLDDPQLAKRIEIASRAVSRGADLTDKLLTFARRRALRPEHADLNVALAQQGDLLARTLGEAIEVELRLAREPCFTQVDTSELQTTLLNLVINARDAMPRGGRLIVSTQRVALDGDIQVFGAEAPQGDFVKVEVSDTGTGMSPKVMDHLFEPFFTTKDVGKGTGLGLSQVYGFVTQSEGYISVESGGSGGTRVAIFLPSAESENDMANTDEVAP